MVKVLPYAGQHKPHTTHALPGAEPFAVRPGRHRRGRTPSRGWSQNTNCAPARLRTLPRGNGGPRGGGFGANRGTGGGRGYDGNRSSAFTGNPSTGSGQARGTGFHHSTPDAFYERKVACQKSVPRRYATCPSMTKDSIWPGLRSILFTASWCAVSAAIMSRAYSSSRISLSFVRASSS